MPSLMNLEIQIKNLDCILKLTLISYFIFWLVKLDDTSTIS